MLVNVKLILCSTRTLVSVQCLCSIYQGKHLINRPLLISAVIQYKEHISTFKIIYISDLPGQFEIMRPFNHSQTYDVRPFNQYRTLTVSWPLRYNYMNVFVYSELIALSLLPYETGLKMYSSIKRGSPALEDVSYQSNLSVVVITFETRFPSSLPKRSERVFFRELFL